MYIYFVFYGLLSANKSFQSINQSINLQNDQVHSSRSSSKPLTFRTAQCLLVLYMEFDTDAMDSFRAMVMQSS